MTDMNDNENNQTTDESEYDDDSDQDMYFDDLEESNYDTINNHDDIPCLEMEEGKFRGNMINGKREGYGVFYYNDGSQYWGNWLNGKRSGEGKYISCKGSIYNGNWENDMKNGKGNIKYLNGNNYDGYWKDNKFSGQGVLVYNNKKYIGVFEDGNPKGRFNIVYGDGSIKIKMFNDGLKVKEIENFSSSPSPNKMRSEESNIIVKSPDRVNSRLLDMRIQDSRRNSNIRRKLISLVNDLDHQDKYYDCQDYYDYGPYSSYDLMYSPMKPSVKKKFYSYSKHNSLYSTNPNKSDSASSSREDTRPRIVSKRYSDGASSYSRSGLQRSRSGPTPKTLSEYEKKLNKKKRGRSSSFSVDTESKLKKKRDRGSSFSGENDSKRRKKKEKMKKTKKDKKDRNKDREDRNKDKKDRNEDN